MTSRRLLDPILKVLLDAADYMEAHGHCKHAIEDSRGRVCLLGAIIRVGKEHFYAASDRMRNYTKHPALSDWNNARERTQEEVVAAFRAAAIAP
jgi:hypothetical protein